MWPPTAHGVSSHNNMMEQSNGSASYNYNGDLSSYDLNNHQPSMTQMQSYQPFHQANGWGRPAVDGTITSPPMYDGIGTSPHGFNGNVRLNYNDRSVDRNSFSNQGPGHMHQGQGSWNPHDSSSKPLPSPVFSNEQGSPQPRPWSNHESGSYNNYRGSGFFNNQNHQHTQRLTAPMAGYQPMQFTPPNHRPNFSGPRGRGSYMPNHSGGRGSRGHARGGNGNGAGPGRGRGRNHPAKSNKSQEGKLVCDPCERWFNNEEQLAKHISEHRTCGVDGCKLTAHTSVVDKHIKMQHDTGLFLKMKDMVNSDDFAKWIAERKMRYPSKENIAKRQEEQDEKVKRGETIGNENGRFPRNRGGNGKRGQRRERGGGRGRNFRERINPHALVEPQENSVSKNFLDAKKEDKSSQLSKVAHAKKPFAHSVDEEQIQDNLPQEERAFSDSEWEAEPETGEGKSAAGVPQLSAALNVLASMYDSDSASENETEGSKSMKLETGIAAQKGDALDEAADSPIEVPISRVALEKEVIADAESPRNASHKRSNPRYQRTEEKSKRRKNNHGDKHTSGFTRKPNVTLLQKLLESEIRHERNVVLQCIRYIMENNFLALTNLEKAENLTSTPTCGQETALCNSEMDLSSTVEVSEAAEDSIV